MASPTPKIKLNPTDAEVLNALQTLRCWFLSGARDDARSRNDPGQVDQHNSPLPPRTHCAAVRRRIAQGAGGAAIVGRRLLLTTEALDEELYRPRKKPVAAVDADDVHGLAAELGLRLVSNGRGRSDL